MKYIGMDIGGANIKIASASGEGFEYYFPFWQKRDQLAESFFWGPDWLTNDTRLGITMTAELADCFEHKREGVEYIVDTVVGCFPNCRPLFYQTDGGMVDAKTAKATWQLTAASNWHASASFLFSESNSSGKVSEGFLIDIGSTTTDLIPVKSHRPTLDCQTDIDRLRNRQLVYAGIGRTPIFGLLQEIQFESTTIPVAREIFATMDDVMLWLGEREESPSDCNSADGRPRTRAAAGQRLSRMVCADTDEIPEAMIDAMARQAKARFVDLVTDSLCHVMKATLSIEPNFIAAGCGGFLAESIVREALNRTSIVKPAGYRMLESGLLNPQLLPAQAVAVERKKQN